MERRILPSICIKHLENKRGYDLAFVLHLKEDHNLWVKDNPWVKEDHRPIKEDHHPWDKDHHPWDKDHHPTFRDLLLTFNNRLLEVPIQTDLHRHFSNHLLLVNFEALLLHSKCLLLLDLDKIS